MKKNNTKGILRKKVKKNKDICFTIMPFGGWSDTYYTNIYSNAIRISGLEPKRADDLYRPSTIVQDIWYYTKKAKIILADLTGKNANVFYELGLAHALAKPAILITESMDDVPFDLRALRVIEYDRKAYNWGEILKEKIVFSINETLEAPITSVLPAFLDSENYKSKGKSKSKSTSKTNNSNTDIIRLKQEVELLKNELGNTRVNIPDISSPEDAKKRIISYVNRNYPDSVIIDRLVRGGAPETWTVEEINRIRKKMRRNNYSKKTTI